MLLNKDPLYIEKAEIHLWGVKMIPENHIKKFSVCLFIIVISIILFQERNVTVTQGVKVKVKVFNFVN